MKEDINNYIFYFEKEVQRLRRWLGSRADKILFVDVGTDPDNADPGKRAFVRQVIGDKKLQELAKGQIFIDQFASEPDDTSETLRIIPLELFLLPDEELNPLIDAIYNGARNDLILGHAVLINQKQFSADGLGKRFRELYMLCTLYHEAAHALIERGPTVDKDHPHRECDADALAALLLLQRFGQEIVPFLHMRSWMRSSDVATYGETSHFTSTIIDKIIFDSLHEDFSKLTVDEMLERAKDYADQWTPKASALKKARHAFGRMIGAINPVKWLLSTTSLSGYKANNLAFYIAAKNALPVLHPEMRVDDTCTHDFREVSRARRLAKHAAKMMFSAVFNNKKATTAPDAALSATAPTVADMITPRAIKIHPARQGRRP